MSTRTTISLPIDIKRRMTKCHQTVNWSKVAAEAFAQVLDRIEKGDNYVSMEDRIRQLEDRIHKLEGKK